MDVEWECQNEAKSVSLTFCVHSLLFHFRSHTFAHLVMIGQFWAWLMIHASQNVRVITILTKFLSQPPGKVSWALSALWSLTGANRFYKWSFPPVSRVSPMKIKIILTDRDLVTCQGPIADTFSSWMHHGAFPALPFPAISSIYISHSSQRIRTEISITLIELIISSHDCNTSKQRILNRILSKMQSWTTEYWGQNI